MALWPFKRSAAEPAGPPGAVTLFFASDLHGSEICFRKFLNAAKFYNADLLVLGGDIAGKLVLPIVAEAGGRFRATLHGEQRTLDAAELPEFEREVANLGFYTRHFAPEEMAHYRDHPEQVEAMFETAIIERLERWVEMAETKLAGSDVTIVFAPGNDDPHSMDEWLATRKSPRFRMVEGEILEVAPGHEMLVTGYTNVTPWNTPREYSEAEIAAHVEAMAGRLKNPETAIFNIHVPPYDSRLDTAPMVGQDLKVKTSLGAQLTAPVGSTAVRDAIRKYQPLLSLHGHIHESGGAVRIGRTVAINPGSEYGEGILHGAVVTVGEGRVVRRQMTLG
jgi:Icc-related predicted phosphoesterase